MLRVDLWNWPEWMASQNLEPSKHTKTQNDSANSNAIKQENLDCAIDMDLVEKETVTPEAVTLAKSKDYLCVDMIENSTELPTDKIEETESGSVVNVTELRVHIIGSPKPKFTLKGFYDNLVRFGKPPQTLCQEQPARPPQQTIVAQYSPQSQGPLQVQGYPQGPVQTQGYPQGPVQAQGYPQGPVQAQGPQGPIQAQGYPQNPTYPPSPQFGQGYPSSPGYPQQGYGQGGGYPQPQGYPQQQVYPQQGGFPQQHGYPGHGPPLQYNPESRNSFVRLVMSLVLVMLMFTGFFIFVVYINTGLRIFFIQSGWLIMIPALVLLIGAQCCLMASACAREPPGNFVCLFLAVIAMSLVAARVTAFFRTEIIMYALIATTIVVMVCIMLSFSSFDFTSYLLYIVGIATAFSVIVMIILIVTMISGTMMKPLLIGILLVGTIIQVVLLTMELQMVLGGGAVEISESDYAIAAFMIYTSIVDLFLKMVQLIGLTQDY